MLYIEIVAVQFSFSVALRNHDLRFNKMVVDVFVTGSFSQLNAVEDKILLFCGCVFLEYQANGLRV